MRREMSKSVTETSTHNQSLIVIDAAWHDHETITEHSPSSRRLLYISHLLLSFIQIARIDGVTPFASRLSSCTPLSTSRTVSLFRTPQNNCRHALLLRNGL